MSKRVITPECRLAFIKLFVPDQYDQDKKPKYMVRCLFAPGTDLSVLQAARMLAAEEKWGNKRPEKWRSPFRAATDGNNAKYAGHEEGWIMINPWSYDRPTVVDGRAQNEILLDGDPRVYAGVWARVSVTAFAYHSERSIPGVSFALNNVQIVRDDEPWSKRVSAEDEFEVVSLADAPSEFPATSGVNDLLG